METTNVYWAYIGMPHCISGEKVADSFSTPPFLGFGV